MLLFTLALLGLPALADDADGDGVDASADCDDTDPEVWTTESSTTKSYKLDEDSEVEAFCDGYCSRAIGYLTLEDVSTTEGLSCVTKISKTLNVNAPELGSLSGLDGVTSIGTFILASSDLPDMRGLDSLSNLDKLWIGCVDGADTEEEELVDELTYCVSGPGVNDSLSSLRGMGPRHCGRYTN